ncbi:MAG: hypothetical protein M0R46_12065 [Candidatus Muirbacterium halophilum]|nr:hypothetical protein [Candidatus Muirbacterium halophilum]MCK9476651.1 hypothetical protein [Candidatus Muirbacterium halophilum]
MYYAKEDKDIINKKLYLKLNNYTDYFIDINTLLNDINQYTLEYFYENMCYSNSNNIIKMDEKLSDEKISDLKEIIIPHIDVKNMFENGSVVNLFKIKKENLNVLTEKLDIYTKGLISIYVAENEIYDFPLN